MIVPTRLLAYGLAAALVLSAAAWTYHRAFVQLPRTKAELVDVRNILAAERDAKVRADLISEGYQRELERLRNRPVVREPVRLCRRAAPRMPAAESRPVAPPATGGVGDEGAGRSDQEGPDIAPDLYAIAQKCDEITAQGRALLQFHSKRSAP